MWQDWLTVWYTPSDNDVIAWMSVERIAEIGGADKTKWGKGPDSNQINSGVAVLSRWLRQNNIVSKPVNVLGHTGFAFTNNSDAVQFKLVWG